MVPDYYYTIEIMVDENLLIADKLVRVYNTDMNLIISFHIPYEAVTMIEIEKEFESGGLEFDNKIFIHI